MCVGYSEGIDDDFFASRFSIWSLPRKCSSVPNIRIRIESFAIVTLFEVRWRGMKTEFLSNGNECCCLFCVHMVHWKYQDNFRKKYLMRPAIIELNSEGIFNEVRTNSGTGVRDLRLDSNAAFHFSFTNPPLNWLRRFYEGVVGIVLY